MEDSFKSIIKNYFQRESLFHVIILFNLLLILVTAKFIISVSTGIGGQIKRITKSIKF